jgi:hypothetical protein
MPYVDAEARKRIAAKPVDLETAGDLNYVITLALIRRWTASPCYRTIHELRKASEAPMKVEWSKELILEWEEAGLYAEFDFEDIETAFKEAYGEFRDRVVKNYERSKAAKNGDVYAGVPYAAEVIGI